MCKNNFLPQGCWKLSYYSLWMHGNHHMQTGDIQDVQILTSYVKAFESYRLTDRQTDILTDKIKIIYHATLWMGNKIKKCSPSQVASLQYTNRLHMTVCFINFIICGTAAGTHHVILTQSTISIVVSWHIVLHSTRSSGNYYSQLLSKKLRKGDQYFRCMASMTETMCGHHGSLKIVFIH